MRRLGLGRGGLVVVALVLACSDDGVPADSNTLSESNGSIEGGGTGTATDSATASDSVSASVSASDSVDEGTGGATSGQGSEGGGTTGADTGPGSEGSCRVDEDCVVIDDCCTCDVGPADAEPPACEIEECLQSTCSANGFTPTAQCELGSCEPVPVSCDRALVACESLPPECPEGSFPGVDPEASCWTGECVPVEACDTVPSCADCPEDEVCLEYATQLGPQYRCSPVRESCEGEPSCACMAEACAAPWDVCSDEPRGLSCSCPTCG